MPTHDKFSDCEIYQARANLRDGVKAAVYEREKRRHWVEPAEILPIWIRSDHVVRIQGIPLDLTEAEAKKIAAVVMAMVDPALSDPALPK